MIDFIKNETPIVICDIGASPVEKTNFIDDLFNNTHSKLVGFEPNVDEYNKLEKNNPKKTFFNFAIGDGTIKTLNICASPGMSSVLEPDIDYLKKFHGFEEWSKIIKTTFVDTKKLDDINENFDFIKIDTQGYESEIIKYGRNKINESLVIQLETSPIPLYKNEKAFASVINQLEDLGFVLHMFNKINTKCFKPMIVGGNILVRGSQKIPLDGLHHLFQLDCVLIKNFRTINNYTEEELKKLILIMHYSFKSYDLVDYLINILDSKNEGKLIDRYRNLAPLLKIQKFY